MLRRTIPATLAIATLGLASAAPTALARHSADDPANHDHHTTTTSHHAKHHHHGTHHHRRGGGSDDGAGHR